MASTQFAIAHSRRSDPDKDELDVYRRSRLRRRPREMLGLRRPAGDGAKPTKNSAATMPNSAMNAGSSTDCDIAAENGSRTKPGNPNRPRLPPRRDARRHLGTDPPCHERGHAGAAQAPRPVAAPSCTLAELAPARCGGRLRVAVAVSGDQTNAMPTPITVNGNTSRQIGVSGAISNESQVNPIASIEKPKPSTGQRGVSVDEPADNRRERPAGDGHRCEQQGRARRRQPAHRLRIEHQRQHHRREANA